MFPPRAYKHLGCDHGLAVGGESSVIINSSNTNINLLLNSETATPSPLYLDENNYKLALI